MRSKRGPLGLLVVVAAFLVFALGASPAQAKFGIARWEALTCNTDESLPGAGNWATNGNPCVKTDPTERFYHQAAGHPPFGINAFLLNQTETPPLPDGNLEYTRTELPEGLGVNPEATPQCTVQQLAEPISATPPLETKCTAEHPGALIGVAYLTTLLPAEATIPALVYNIETPDDPSSPYYGAPSLAGFNAAGTPTYLVGDLDPKDQHISFTSKPDLKAPPPFVIGFRLVFFGRSGKGYITIPSECDGPLTSVFKAFSLEGEEDTADSVTPYSATGCNEVPFDPGLGVSAGSKVDSPEPATVDVSIPFNPDPTKIQSSQLKVAKVVLPEGAGINPSAANGLETCSDAQFAKGTNTPISCPEPSKVGSVEVETPSLPGVLGGEVYVGEPLSNSASTGEQFRLFLHVTSVRFGVNVRLVANVFPNPETGQLTALVKENPQAPFEHFKVHIDGGPRGVLTSPNTCGPNKATSALTPFSGNADAEPSSEFTMTEGGSGGDCPKTLGDRPFAPTYSAGPKSNKAGAFSPLELHIARPDGAQEIRQVNVDLPPGMVAKLKGVEYCPEASIAAAEHTSGKAEQATPSCPGGSLVGNVGIDVGSGSKPFHTSGKAYLAGPYKGAPISMVFVVPAVAGPYDLGTDVVRAALNIDPETAEVHAVSDPIPFIFGGVKLDIRKIDLSIDRTDFTLNPTTCRSAFPIVGGVFGGGSNPLNPANWFESRPATEFRATECGKLKFKPKFHARIFGGKNQTKRTANPKFRTILEAGKGDANLRRATFILPSATFLDQSHIRTVCTRVQLSANQCPQKSIYGNAKATSPLLGKALQGPVYLVSSDNKLPDLLVDLKGQVNIRLRGVISSVHGRLKTVFANTPDVPVTKFILTMKGGNRGLLVNSRNLCSRQTAGYLKLKAQNSRQMKTKNLRFNIPACGGKKKH